MAWQSCPRKNRDLSWSFCCPFNSLISLWTGLSFTIFLVIFTRFVKSSVGAQAPQAQNTWCMRQLVYVENCMGKSPIVKKIVQITISFEIKFSYLLLEGEVTVSNKFTKRRQNGFKFGTRDNFATHLR